MVCNRDCFNCVLPDCIESEKEAIRSARSKMSISIRSEVGKNNLGVLSEWIHDAGYKNVRQFCKDVGIDQSNLYSNLNGKWGMSIKRMFKIANSLKVPIADVIELFYPDDYYENKMVCMDE